MPDSIVTIVGTLGAAPELRFTQSGKGVANFNVAVNRKYQQNNEWITDTSWFTVVAWGELGENCSATLDKGMRVIVTGRLEQRSWEDDKGGKRSTVEIVADEVGPALRWATAQVERTQHKDGANPAQQYREPASASSSVEEPF